MLRQPVRQLSGSNLDWYALKDNSLAKIHAITLISDGTKSIACVNFLGQLTPVSGFNEHHVFGAILDCETGAAYPPVKGKRSYHFDLRYGLENDSTIALACRFHEEQRLYVQSSDLSCG